MKREPADVTSDFAIFRKESDELFRKVSPALLNSPDGTQASLVKVPPIFPTLLLVVLFDQRKALVPDLINNEHTPIPPELYRARIRAVAPNRIYQTERDFEIGATADVMGSNLR